VYYTGDVLTFDIMTKKKEPLVEQVFLIYRDGRLISHASLGREKEIDTDILGGMLTAVMNLLNTVLSKNETDANVIEYYKFEMGERKIILDMGNHFFITIVFLGIENDSLRSKIKGVVRDIERKYEEVLGSWSGKMKDFDGAYEIILTLLPLEELPEEEKEVIKERGISKTVIDTWSKIHHSLMQETIIPRASTWKKLSFKLDSDDEKGKEEDIQEED
jgi:hypothetical protein